MTNLTTWSSPLDDLLSGFFVRPAALDWRAGQPVPFRMDVYEGESAYRVVADLPGARKEDIKVTIEGGEVTISAEARREQPADGGERQLLCERENGAYQRTFSLGYDIDEANAQARYADGVLELTLPKSPDALPRRITIQ